MNLRDYLTQNGIKQTEFAAMVGTTAATVCRICGGQIPRRDLMRRIIEATGGAVKADDLIAVPVVDPKPKENGI